MITICDPKEAITTNCDRETAMVTLCDHERQWADWIISGHLLLKFAEAPLRFAIQCNDFEASTDGVQDQSTKTSQSGGLSPDPQNMRSPRQT